MTDFFWEIAVRRRVRAGSIPPMTSMMMSIDGSVTIDSASVVSNCDEIFSRGAERFRTAIFFNAKRAPERSAKSPESSLNKRATWEPTTPQPNIPIEISLSAAMVSVLLPQFFAPSPQRLRLGGRTLFLGAESFAPCH